jgi:hypothetical protein
MTYRDWPNPGRLLTEIGQISAYNKLESQKKMRLNQQPKAIIRGRAIPACRWNFLIDSRGLENAG